MPKVFANRQRGEVIVDGLGVMRFDYDRIACLTEALGPRFDEKVSAAAMDWDVETLTIVAAIGLDLSPDAVRSMSPPILPLFQNIMAALNLAYHGTKEAPGDPDENPSRMRQLMRRILSWLPSVSGAAPVTSPPGFGD